MRSWPLDFSRSPVSELVRTMLTSDWPAPPAIVRRVVAFVVVLMIVDVVMARSPGCQIVPRNTEEARNVCYEALSAWSTFATAVLTFGLLLAAAWVARKQIGLMNRQTDIIDGTLKAAEESAGAAKKSADYAAASQRPWVVVRSTNVVDSDTRTERPALEGWPEYGEEVTFPRPYFLNWQITNFGPTPAWIEQFRYGLRLTDWPLPPEPLETRMNDSFHGLLVTKDRPHGHRDELVFTEETWHRVLTGQLCLLFWGTVEYRDGMEPDRLRVTRFCETWMVGPRLGMHEIRFQPLGPTAAWTGHT